LASVVLALPQSRDPPQSDSSSTIVAPQFVVGGGTVLTVIVVVAAAPTTAPPRPINRLIVVLALSLPLGSTSLLSLPSTLANLPTGAAEGIDKEDALAAIALALLQHCRGVVGRQGKRAR
jgi:hypothetical protein